MGGGVAQVWEVHQTRPRRVVEGLHRYLGQFLGAGGKVARQGVR